MTDETTQQHDDKGQFTTTHGAAGLMRRVQDNKPWPAEAVQELAILEGELSTPTGRRTVKNATVAEMGVIQHHYAKGWMQARAAGDEKGMLAALNALRWITPNFMRGIRDLDESDKAPDGPSAAQVLEAAKENG